MGLFRKTPEEREARDLQREHNARFNHPGTDPDDPAFLASHDRVVAAQRKAKQSRR